MVLSQSDTRLTIRWGKSHDFGTDRNADQGPRASIGHSLYVVFYKETVNDEEEAGSKRWPE